MNHNKYYIYCIIFAIFPFSMISCGNSRENDYRNSCLECEKIIEAESYDKVTFKEGSYIKPSKYYSRHGHTFVVDFSYTPVAKFQYDDGMLITISKDLKKATMQIGQKVLENFIIYSINSYTHLTKIGFCENVYNDRREPISQYPEFNESRIINTIIRTNKGHIIINHNHNINDSFNDSGDTYCFKVFSGDKIYYTDFLYSRSSDEKDAFVAFAKINNIPYTTLFPDMEH